MRRPYERRWKNSRGEERRAWVVEYLDSSGDRIRQQYSKKGDASRFWEELVRRGAPKTREKKITVGEAADHWLRVCEIVGRDGRPAVEPATLARYKIHAEKHIKPRIGSRVIGGVHGSRR